MLEDERQGHILRPPAMSEIIMRFARVVGLGWEEVVASVPVAYKQDTLNDWLQFHWELLVEWPLRLQYPGLFLEIYGEGAETDSSRISETEALANHRVACRPVAGGCLKEMIGESEIKFSSPGFPVNEFVNCLNGQWHKSEPPFNAVLVYSPEATPNSPTLPLVFSLDEVEFILQKIDPAIESTTVSTQMEEP